MQVLDDEEFIRLIDESVTRAAVDLGTRFFAENPIYRSGDQVEDLGWYVGLFQVKLQVDQYCKPDSDGYCACIGVFYSRHDSSKPADGWYATEVEGLSSPA